MLRINERDELQKKYDDILSSSSYKLKIKIDKVKERISKPFKK